MVLSTLQTWSSANEGSNLSTSPVLALNGTSEVWLTPAMRNVSATGFEVALESASVDNNGSASVGIVAAETIGYIAIENNVSTQLSNPGGALVGFATATASATSTCTSTGLSFPAGTPTNAVNLRAFAGLQSRNEDDGGWLRRCGITSTGTSTSIGVRIDEDSDLSTDRNHPTAESVGEAVFGGDFTTTPVTLALLRASPVGSDALDVELASASEIGHLGYRIWGRAKPTDVWRALHSDLIANAGGDSFSGRSYQRRVEAKDISEIRIEDIDVRGQSRFHPPLAVGAGMGAPSQDTALDWNAIRAANAATPARTRRPAGAAQVHVKVRENGIQRVSFEALRAAGFSDALLAEAVAVLVDGVAVPRFIACPDARFGPGCVVEWLGRTRDSLYGKARTYVLIDDRSLAIPVSGGAIVSGTSTPKIIVATPEQAPDRAYTFSAPGADPWFDERLLAQTAPVQLTRSFTLPDRAPAPVALEVQLWGGLDYPDGAADHSVELLLNGQLIAQRRFDGLVAETISVTLDNAGLQPVNTLTVRLPADTGQPADVVLLDGFKVRYQRASTLLAGELAFGNFATAATHSDSLFADGFDERASFQLGGISTSTIVWSETPDGVQRRDLVSTSSAVRADVAALYASDEAHIRRPVAESAVSAALDLSATDYLIVTHPLFEAELAPLIALQQARGLRVRVLRTDSIYAALNHHQPDPDAIAAAIAEIKPRFVLLVGGDSYDYNDNLGLGSQSYVPTYYRVASPIVRFAPSDQGFVDVDRDGAPERALGRIPARTVEELRRAITSIVERGNIPASSIFASAGVSSPSEHFDVHSRTLLSYLRQGQPVEFGLVDEINLEPARTALIAALSGGAQWINYLGHSSPNRWALQNLINTSQLGAIQRTGLAAVVSQWGCWNNHFVLPNQDTMSHALMLRPNHLAAAVIGSTSLAEDASHLALATRFFDLLEDGRIGDEAGAAVGSIGEALLQAKQSLARDEPQYIESNWSISLFGDPAMPLR